MQRKKSQKEKTKNEAMQVDSKTAEHPQKRKTEVNDEITQDSQIAKKTKKKSKKKKEDESFHPKKYDYSNPFGTKKPNTSLTNEEGNFLHWMYDNDTSFTNTSGEKVEIKTSVMVDYQALIQQSENKGVDWADMCERLLAVFSQVPSFRPAETIEYSKNGSPVKLKTPSKGTELIREKKIGFLHFYSNRPTVIPLDEVTSQTKINPESEFFSSPSYAAVQTIKEIVKSQKAIITRDLLQETKKENAEKGNVRSQNPVMVNQGFAASEASAQKYAEATKLFSVAIPMKWQWLHLVAHFIWGEESQIPENLIVGSKPGNSDMDSVETQLKYLAKQYPEGFELVVESDLIEGTQMGVNMKYFIKTKDFLLPFEFNVQTPNMPHISQPDYIKKFIHTLVDKCDEARQTQDTSPPAKKKIDFEGEKFPFFAREKKDPQSQTTIATQDVVNTTSDPQKEENEPQNDYSLTKPE